MLAVACCNDEIRVYPSSQCATQTSVERRKRTSTSRANSHDEEKIFAKLCVPPPVTSLRDEDSILNFEASVFYLLGLSGLGDPDSLH